MLTKEKDVEHDPLSLLRVDHHQGVGEAHLAYLVDPWEAESRWIPQGAMTMSSEIQFNGEVAYWTRKPRWWERGPWRLWNRLYNWLH